MTDFLYLTADQIGAPTGGGLVTRHEALALTDLAQSLGMQCQAWSFPGAERPWGSDEQAVAMLRDRPDYRPKLAHIYAGCFTETVRELHRRGCKVAYTVAAHDRHVSREEHEALGLPFPYPHLTDEEQFARYSGGYREADVVIAPGEAPRRVLERDGVEAGRIRIIPHGYDPPSSSGRNRKERMGKIMGNLQVGYLGAVGADKGLRYLFEAWAKLDYKDATLHVAGPGTEDLYPLVRHYGRGNVSLRGRLKSPSLLFNAVDLYVQPSASEGFGIAVVEAAGHWCPTICSDGAGAADWAACVVKARDADDIAEAIEAFRDKPYQCPPLFEPRRSEVTWPRVRERYKAMWREMLACPTCGMRPSKDIVCCGRITSGTPWRPLASGEWGTQP